MFKTTIIGFLTADPTSRKVGNSTAADFRLGVRTARKNQQGEYITNFVSVTAFGQSADYVINNAKKGTKVTLLGSFADVDYKKKDGTEGHALTVTADTVDIAYTAKPDAGAQKRTPQATEPPLYDNVDPNNPF